MDKKCSALLKLNMKLQPHVVFLTKDCDLIDLVDSVSYAVLGNTVYYECASILDAVDICIKATFVFGIEYPLASSSCWLFLQKSVYQLTSEYDVNSIKVNALMSDIA